jgi:predicted MFS family arabinose efflux permease
VAGQAIASAVVVGVMVADGFDIPLSKITGDKAASDSFMNGWKFAYILVTVFSLFGLALAIVTKPKRADQDE